MKWLQAEEQLKCEHTSTHTQALSQFACSTHLKVAPLPPLLLPALPRCLASSACPAAPWPPSASTPCNTNSHSRSTAHHSTAQHFINTRDRSCSQHAGTHTPEEPHKQPLPRAHASTGAHGIWWPLAGSAAHSHCCPFTQPATRQPTDAPPTCCLPLLSCRRVQSQSAPQSGSHSGSPAHHSAPCSMPAHTEEHKLRYNTRQPQGRCCHMQDTCTPRLLNKAFATLLQRQPWASCCRNSSSGTHPRPVHHRTHTRTCWLSRTPLRSRRTAA